MDNDNKDRDKALDMALAQIDKQFGKGSIIAPRRHGNVGVAAISTGALSLDLALGLGGLPRGGSSRSSVGVVGGSRRSPCTLLPKPNAMAASAPTSMPSTRWTR